MTAGIKKNLRGHSRGHSHEKARENARGHSREWGRCLTGTKVYMKSLMFSNNCEM